ncbi:MAG: hypothetical protein ACYTBX_18985 [Planctomycetota bacterium]|jgi:hypothetical protein
MDKRQIDRFFKIVDAEFGQAAKAILTGAAAGTIWGSTRPSMDIDFAIELKSSNRISWKNLESAIRKAIDETGIQANYSEDIDRWGMITLLDYKKNTELYKKQGKLTLLLLNPAYWSIGKVTRFLNPDIQDMIQVFRKKKIPPAQLAEVWGKALRASPRSTALARFRRHVEGFFESYGTKIWGRSFNAQDVIQRFHTSADIRK